MHWGHCHPIGRYPLSRLRQISITIPWAAFRCLPLHRYPLSPIGALYWPRPPHGRLLQHHHRSRRALPRQVFTGKLFNVEERIITTNKQKWLFFFFLEGQLHKKIIPNNQRRCNSNKRRSETSEESGDITISDDTAVPKQGELSPMADKNLI